MIRVRVRARVRLRVRVRVRARVTVRARVKVKLGGQALQKTSKPTVGFRCSLQNASAAVYCFTKTSKLAGGRLCSERWRCLEITYYVSGIGENLSLLISNIF